MQRWPSGTILRWPCRLRLVIATAQREWIIEEAPGCTTPAGGPRQNHHLQTLRGRISGKGPGLTARMPGKDLQESGSLPEASSCPKRRAFSQSLPKCASRYAFLSSPLALASYRL